MSVKNWFFGIGLLLLIFAFLAAGIFTGGLPWLGPAATGAIALWAFAWALSHLDKWAP